MVGCWTRGRVTSLTPGVLIVTYTDLRAGLNYSVLFTFLPATARLSNLISRFSLSHFADFIPAGFLLPFFKSKSSRPDC